MVAVQPWWCFYFAAVLATRILGDLQCFGFVPVFFQPLEWQSCMQACSSGRDVDCVRRQALAFRGCTAQARNESGWRNSFDFWREAGRITIRHGCMAASAACVDSGPRAGGAGWANIHCPKKLMPAQESKPGLFSRT